MAREKTTAPATAVTLHRRGDKGDRGDGTRNDVGKLGTGDEGHDGGREVHSDDVEKGGTGDEVEKGGTDVLVSVRAAKVATAAQDDEAMTWGRAAPATSAMAVPRLGKVNAVVAEVDVLEM
ncbi:hypothetical protein PInf_017765 [Phytophthora infestans]|nr:hypothetical protein PInf_017765 [Phytophthora infestans]